MHARGELPDHILERLAEFYAGGPIDHGLEMVQTVLSGKGDPDTKRRRLERCRACPSGMMERDKGSMYCKACDCPHWRFATLENKAGYRHDSCILGHWKGL